MGLVARSPLVKTYEPATCRQAKREHEKYTSTYVRRHKKSGSGGRRRARDVTRRKGAPKTLMRAVYCAGYCRLVCACIAPPEWGGGGGKGGGKRLPLASACTANCIRRSCLGLMGRLRSRSVGRSFGLVNAKAKKRRGGGGQPLSTLLCVLEQIDNTAFSRAILVETENANTHLRFSPQDQRFTYSAGDAAEQTTKRPYSCINYGRTVTLFPPISNLEARATSCAFSSDLLIAEA